MNLVFHRRRISGILVVLPDKEISFLEEMKNYNFPEERSRKLMGVMGYNTRRVAVPGICFSDMAVFGLQTLFDRGLLHPEEIDALIVATSSGDYILPPTSNVVQGRLGLKQEMFCLDINQACSGFVVGLMQSFGMLEQESIRKVVMITGDVLSQRTSHKDRSLYPLIGDAISITIVERAPEESNIYGVVKMDGSHMDALMIPAGGVRLPCSPETAVMEPSEDNNCRAQNHLRMDGAAVFNFVMSEVPPLIEGLLSWAGVSVDQVDYFLCHQSNRFMLKRLAEKLSIPASKMPDSVVERFGNSSGSTIPVAAVLDLAEPLRNQDNMVCITGYGAGLTAAALLMKMGHLSFCEMVEFSTTEERALGEPS